MNKRKKNICMYISENESSFGDKCLNESMKLCGKMNSFVGLQKPMIIKNSEKLMWDNSKISLNKSLDVSNNQKLFDVGDKNKESSANHKSKDYIKSLISETEGVQQSTPIFAKIKPIGKFKLTNVSKSTNFKESKQINGMGEKVLNERRGSFSRNIAKNGSFDKDNNSNIINNSLSKTNHSLALNSLIMNNLNTTMKSDLKMNDFEKKEFLEIYDLNKLLDDKLFKLNQLDHQESLPYYNQLCTVYKTHFNEVLKSFPALNDIKVLFKIVDGFNQLVHNLINRCTKFQNKVHDLELNLMKYTNLNEEYTVLKKILVLKEDQLEKIKVNLKSDNSSVVASNGKDKPRTKEEDNKYRFIKYIENESFSDDEENNNISCYNNKIRIDDLEAIYFPDKVKMRSFSASNNNVPKLDFKVVKSISKFNQENTNIHKNIQNVEDLDLKDKVLKNCNPPLPNPQKRPSKNYVIPNSKKVIINIENNQDKNYNKFINK